MIAEKVVKDFNVDVSGDLAFIAATLCNVGKLVGCICLPEEIDAIYRATKSLQKLSTWTIAEQQMGACDHRILGEIAASLWGLPDYVLEAIQHHHDTFASNRWGKTPATLNNVVVFSSQLSHWIRLEPFRIDKQILNGCSKLLGFI